MSLDLDQTILCKEALKSHFIRSEKIRYLFMLFEHLLKMNGLTLILSYKCFHYLYYILAYIYIYLGMNIISDYYSYRATINYI